MSRVIQIVNKHKISAIAYILYLFLWYNILTTEWRFKAALSHIDEGEKVAWGEGVMYGDLLILALGVGGALVCLINAVINKQNRRFYLLMSLLMLLPAIIFIVLTDFFHFK